MIKKLLWILGVGIPMYYLVFSGIMGLGFPYGYYDYVIKLDIFGSILALGIGGAGTYGLIYHYRMRHKGMGKHCELTSFGEGALAIGVVIGAVVMGLGFFTSQWFTILLVALIGGGVGLVLYRIEMKKKLWPF